LQPELAPRLELDPLSFSFDEMVARLHFFVFFGLVGERKELIAELDREQMFLQM
jgi:hypothetical protein